MSAEPKRRGRPKGDATRERERIEDMLRNSLPHIPLITPEERAAIEQSWLQGEVVRQEILKDYKYDPTVPDSHAYNMASLGDESLIGYERLIIAADASHREAIPKRKLKGTQATRDGALDRAATVRSINSVLLESMTPRGRLSVEQVIQIIGRGWDQIDPADRKQGEPATLKKRGCGGPTPCAKTIRSYITGGR